MQIQRRISAIFKDVPGGQCLGSTFDYTHRLIDFKLAAEGDIPIAPEQDYQQEATPRVIDTLGQEGLIQEEIADDTQPIFDLTRQPLTLPAGRDARLQNLARADEGFLLSLAYSTQRGYGRNHPFAGEIRMGEVEVVICPEELGIEIAIASHDDATAAHIQEAIENGVTIAEFPTTLEAASVGHKQGLKILMGAPNIVLGHSHSGNISAIDLVEQDWVDSLSSDYAPQSLLQAVFIIARKTAKPLYETIKLVTINPAKAVNLAAARGSLEVGKRADLITVHDDGIVPRLTSVVVQGKRVA